MTSVKNANISVVQTPLQIIEPRQARVQQISSNQTGLSITQYHPDLSHIIGHDPTHSLLLSSTESSQNPFFHSACVFVPERGELYTTSKPLQSADFARLPVILISKIKTNEDANGNITSVEWTKLRPPPNMLMPAGASLSGKGIMYCSQGSQTPGTGGVYWMPYAKPPEPVVTNYYGRDFNSPYAVDVSEDDAVWFTDPTLGFEGEYRNAPQLPPQVYRCDRKSGEVRAVADGFDRPMGIALNHTQTVLYVSDAGASRGDGTQNLSRPASIYAFDIIRKDKTDKSPFLGNRRLFAFVRKGVPHSLRCDQSGNIWAACGDGLEIWNAGGSLLGVIEVPGGISSFCPGKHDDIFLCAGQRLWRIRLPGAQGPLI